MDEVNESMQPDIVAVFGADHIYRMDPSQMVAQHIETGAGVTVAAIRQPIAISMFLAGATGYILQAGWLPFAGFMNTQAFARFAGYDLSVIPLFILMGALAERGGLARDLFEKVSKALAQ